MFFIMDLRGSVIMCEDEFFSFFCCCWFTSQYENFPFIYLFIVSSLNHKRKRNDISLISKSPFLELGSNIWNFIFITIRYWKVITHGSRKYCCCFVFLFTTKLTGDEWMNDKTFFYAALSYSYFFLCKITKVITKMH